MLVAKHNFVESCFFGNKSNLGHTHIALHNLQWENTLHLFSGVRNHFVFFPFVQNIKYGFCIFGSIESKLNVISLSFEHNRNN